MGVQSTKEKDFLISKGLSVPYKCIPQNRDYISFILFTIL